MKSEFAKALHIVGYSFNTIQDKCVKGKIISTDLYDSTIQKIKKRCQNATVREGEEKHCGHQHCRVGI